jgi:hypothetical protein
MRGLYRVFPIPRMGWTFAVLIGFLLWGGYWYIVQRMTYSEVLRVGRDLPAFSIVDSEFIETARLRSRPEDAVSQIPKNGWLITLGPLQAGTVLRRSDVVSFAAGADLDLLALSIANSVVARPGDEIFLVGVSGSGNEELGSAVFLGKTSDQAVVALCHENALRVIPFSTRQKRVVALRVLSIQDPGKSGASPRWRSIGGTLRLLRPRCEAANLDMNHRDQKSEPESKVHN